MTSGSASTMALQANGTLFAGGRLLDLFSAGPESLDTTCGEEPVAQELFTVWGEGALNGMRPQMKSKCMIGKLGLTRCSGIGTLVLPKAFIASSTV